MKQKQRKAQKRKSSIHAKILSNSRGLLAMGTLVLQEPLFYYRRHAQNLYAIDGENEARLRRKR